MKLNNTLLAVFTSATIVSAAAIIKRGDEACIPTSYTLSDYTLTTSSDSASVNFDFQSTFPVSNTDSVQSIAHCSASGPSIPNSNECAVPRRALLFDLRGPQEQAYYQITHTWSCNGSTWMSGNAVKVDPLDCHDEGGARVCTCGPMTLAPQNVRKICSTPTCPTV